MFIFTMRIYKFFADLRNVRRFVAIQIVIHYYMAPAAGFHVRCPAGFPAGDAVVSNRGIIAGIRWKPFPKRLLHHP